MATKFMNQSIKYKIILDEYLVFISMSRRNHLEFLGSELGLDGLELEEAWENFGNS